MTALSAESLSVRTTDGTDLLADVSLGVEPGETVLLCGGPGSGKTLLAKALRGLLDDRNDLSVSGTIHRGGDIGFVFQDPGTQLVRRVTKHDVAFGLENRGVPAEEIEDRIARHAARLDAEGLLDRPVRELSGGETAKVALLGVLVTDPEVVILDEPLAALDHPNTKLVLDAIDRLRGDDVAVVVAEHDLRDLLCRGDCAVLLRAGRIASRGPPDEVVRDLYRASVKVPFAAEVAIERDDAGDAPVPLSSEVDPP